MIITINDKDFKIETSDSVFKYQILLTNKLDSSNNQFDQNTLNEIVLWKVNRYAEFTTDIISKINKIKETDIELNEKITYDVLSSLLGVKGVALPMASTILRFKNKNIYQIIDQRVYRIIYGKELKLTKPKTKEATISQIKLYIDYLKDLRGVCTILNIDYINADRILYLADKRINKRIKIKN